jgi:NADPH:quinone reductase-like Zn-dependent oxidoreductase
MRAAVVGRYGPPTVVTVEERAVPVPRRGEVLVEVEAVAVSSGDARIRAARFPRGYGAIARPLFGLRGPRRPVLGGSLSGTVVRSDDPDLPVGTRVSGMTGLRLGGHAEYAAARARELVRTPDRVSAAEAAGTLFGGSTALHFLDGRVRRGSRVLVVGAAGAVGTSAVQLARHLGATEITAVTTREALATDLGATSTVPRATLGSLDGRYDVVLDAVGALPRATGLALSGPDGTLVQVVAGMGDTVRAPFARGRVVAGPATERAEAFARLLALVESGELDPVTEVVGGLEAVVAAYERIDAGDKVGNLVVEPQR